MLKTVKGIFGSKIVRFLFSVGLVYFAFRKIDVGNLLTQLRMVPWWFLVVMIAYLFFSMGIGAIRWALVILDKPSWTDFKKFLNASFRGNFYSLFFPSAVGGDIVKWLPLVSQYPSLSKTKLASSVLVDRIIGLSAFVFMAFVSALVGKMLNFRYPNYLFWMFFLLFLVTLLFYVLVFTVDFHKIFGKFVFMRRVLVVLDAFKGENKKRVFLCLLISIVSEPVWILPNYFYSLLFGTGMSLLSIFIFLPIINLIIVLPISFAGFGARENLFIFFFGQLGLSTEKILLVSTFSGIMNILNALLGGLISLI